MRGILTKAILFLMSHIQTVKESHLQISGEICAQLGITPEDLKWLFVEAGLLYLDKALENDEQGREQLLKSPLFWGWFKNKWMQLDEEILKGDHLLTYRPDQTEYYLEAHRTQMLEQTIPAVVRAPKNSLKSSTVKTN